MNNKLKNSIIKQIGGKDYLKDVYNHGADSGYPGFTYYNDTCAFFKRHKKAIVELAEEMANSLGEDVLSMIKNFNCLNGEYTEGEIARVLYGNWKDKDFYTYIANAMTWFALEECSREIYDGN